jgi:hypothetical protein
VTQDKAKDKKGDSQAGTTRTRGESRVDDTKDGMDEDEGVATKAGPDFSHARCKECSACETCGEAGASSHILLVLLHDYLALNALLRSCIPLLACNEN